MFAALPTRGGGVDVPIFPVQPADQREKRKKQRLLGYELTRLLGFPVVFLIFYPFLLVIE